MKSLLSTSIDDNQNSEKMTVKKIEHYFGVGRPLFWINLIFLGDE